MLAGGYRLCSRCGNILCAADTVQVVYRNASWGIYTHLQGPNCPEKAVSGWRAVELAMDMRATNVPTPREANLVSVGHFDFPFVSLLDDEHCHAEMATVTISQREFLPAAQRPENGDENLPDLIENWGDCRRWREWRYMEAKMVEAIDRRICGALAKIARHVLKHERLTLYANSRAERSPVNLSEKDLRPKRTLASFSAHSGTPTAQTKSKARPGRSRGLNNRLPRMFWANPVNTLCTPSNS